MHVIALFTTHPSSEILLLALWYWSHGVLVTICCW